MTVAVTRLAYMGVGASNLAAWEDFATNVLGVDISEKGPDGTLYLRYDNHHYRIAVHPDPSDDLLYSGWQVPDEFALQDFADHLTSKGISFETGTREDAQERNVGGLIRFKDPSGLALEIFYAPLVDYKKPFRPTRPISGFVTGEQGLGHFVAAMNDFDVSKEFYLHVMGMRISDYIERRRPDGGVMRIAFLHCNPRHHSIGFSSAAAGGKRLRHIMIEVGELDDLGMTYDLARDLGIAETSIGRHPNDRQVSFYLRTPSGWQIEYGWGARPVNDSTLQIEMFNTISLWGHKREDGTAFGDPPRAAQQATQAAR